MAQYECSICWYIYDESKGIPEEAIEENSRFDSFDDGWQCPHCGSLKEKFLRRSQDEELDEYQKRIYLYENILRKNMQGVERFGLMNKNLEVELCAFHKQDADYMIGVCISPLSINLVRFPIEKPEEYPAAGEKFTHHFPFASFEFTAAIMDDFGYFEQCSLFSPALEFADHKAAVATAKEVMALLQKPAEEADITETNKNE
ncbi:MAG: [NiFe]-hydrogenase assembly chaperone HybE [Alphaproteobacteria bacterium]